MSNNSDNEFDGCGCLILAALGIGAVVLAIGILKGLKALWVWL